MSVRLPNALTVDVEHYFHVSALSSTISRDNWDHYERRVESHTRKLLDLFAEYGAKATFFVLGWVAERHPDLVREIAAAGHQVACHGYSHRLVYEQTPEAFRGETRRSKALLEDQAQQPVGGYRAASYSITQRSLWALDILAEAGFVYDSRIFPVRHDRYGIPGSQTVPHCLTTASGGQLMEFPLSTANIFGYRLALAGGRYFRLYPYWLTRAGLRSIKRQGQPFMAISASLKAEYCP